MTTDPLPLDAAFCSTCVEEARARIADARCSPSCKDSLEHGMMYMPTTGDGKALVSVDVDVMRSILTTLRELAEDCAAYVDERHPEEGLTYEACAVVRRRKDRDLEPSRRAMKLVAPFLDPLGATYIGDGGPTDDA